MRARRSALKREAKDWERRFEAAHGAKATAADRKGDRICLQIRRCMKHADEALVILAEEGEDIEEGFVDLAVANTQDKIEVLTEAVDLVEEVLGFQFDDTAASKQGAAIVEDEFGALAAAIVAAFDAGEMPTGEGGDAEAFEAAWKDWVKALGKSLGRKGKRLFMPIRLAVTGTMSGGDIGTQLRLVAAADGVVAPEKVVPLAQRIEKLRAL